MAFRDTMPLPCSALSLYNAGVNTARSTTPLAYSPSVDNLRNLLIVRSIALLLQLGVLAYVLVANSTASGLNGIMVSLAVLALLTIASLWRTTRPWPVADNEFLAQLLLDVLGWTSLMYFTGGANNPFVSYYIVPLVIAAAVLPWRHTWLVAGCSLLAYSLLLYFYVPFPLFTPHAAMGHDQGANMHILGMWFNFLFSASLITYFVVRMATILRRQELIAVERREDRLRNDQIMAVASLAAGTAHELGTPLATMTLLADEIRQDPGLGHQSREDCELLREQLSLCKSTLAELSRTAELSSIDQKQRQGAGDFTRGTVERWAVRRPGIVYEIQCDGSGPTIEFDLTMGQALENLLNNAADAGSERIEVGVTWDRHEVHIGVRDWGKGIPAELMEQLGKPIIHASKSGLGIGLMLSQATVQRYGGRIELRNTDDGGTIATLTLPLRGHSRGDSHD